MTDSIYNDDTCLKCGELTRWCKCNESKINKKKSKTPICDKHKISIFETCLTGDLSYKVIPLHIAEKLEKKLRKYKKLYNRK